ncbi:hypothetical protein K439DRAFT_1335319 [Ramaria rubella]|nr:hypothetical protein K439DRAFT_1335319 [Ramaria rubella]
MPTTFVSKISSPIRILVYPPRELGAISVTIADMDQLEPGVCLNDLLVEFGLKCVRESQRIPHI